MSNFEDRFDPPVDKTIPEIYRFFEYSHLPEKLQTISKPFMKLAAVILELPNSAEKSVALRKLLEAKDAAVRAAL